MSNHPAGWVNVCEPEAVRLFLRMTHEVYEKRLAHYFASKTILGIFTDEPGHPVAISDDVPYPCEIPARGVLVLGPGERPAAPGTPIELGSLAYALDRDIFGDHDRPDAQWDMRFWNPQHDSETAPAFSPQRATSPPYGRGDGKWARRRPLRGARPGHDPTAAE